MQEGLNLKEARAKSKPRRSKGQIIEIHGGRIIGSTGVKDRHSKVCTARGPRNRRLRLSPNTAIQFYDVQDRLGYDRPSKAIDWLMKEAKASGSQMIRSKTQDPSVPTSGLSFISMENGANDEFNSVGYQQGGLVSVSALNPSRIFNWNHGLGGGGIFMNSEQDHIFFQREPLQSSINYPPALYSPLSTQITTVGFAPDLSKLVSLGEPEEDKIPVSSKHFSSL